MSPTPVILDMDPGHDDAIAMLVALGSPALEVVGITTVAGNQTLARTTRNACRVLTVAGARGLEVAAGADRPLVRDQVLAADIHGESGLDGPILPEPRVAVAAEPAVLHMAGLLRAARAPVTLIPTGPLTNVALLLRLFPELAGRIREIVWMGGSTREGNVTPAAEFNAFADPEAAHVVFTAGVALRMVGLNLTHQAVATPDVVERIAALPGPVPRLVVDLLEFFTASYRRVFAMPAPPVHDACAVAAVIDPGLVTSVPAHVAVELGGRHTYGATVVDRGGARPANCQVAVGLDRSGFWDLVTAALARL